MDYVISRAFQYNFPLLEKLKLAFLAYDIVCSWGVFWKARFDHACALSDTVPEGLELLRAIGQWHIHGHKKQCSCRFGFPFMRGAGLSDGEIVETLWSFLNEFASTARAMTRWHRIEYLNDALNSWNRRKLLNARRWHSFKFGCTTILPFIILLFPLVTAATVLKRWKQARANYDVQKSAYEGIRVSMGGQYTASMDGWIQAAVEAENHRNDPGKKCASMDIFLLKADEGRRESGLKGHGGDTDSVRYSRQDTKGDHGLPSHVRGEDDKQISIRKCGLRFPSNIRRGTAVSLMSAIFKTLLNGSSPQATRPRHSAQVGVKTRCITTQ